MFKQYRRKQIAELRPYVPGERMDGISVGAVDAAAGSPKSGDMIARNPAKRRAVARGDGLFRGQFRAGERRAVAYRTRARGAQSSERCGK
jgi:hypothetical protein